MGNPPHFYGVYSTIRAVKESKKGDGSASASSSFKRRRTSTQIWEGPKGDYEPHLDSKTVFSINVFFRSSRPYVSFSRKQTNNAERTIPGTDRGPGNSSEIGKL